MTLTRAQPRSMTWVVVVELAWKVRRSFRFVEIVDDTDARERRTRSASDRLRVMIATSASWGRRILVATELQGLRAVLLVAAMRLPGVTLAPEGWLPVAAESRGALKLPPIRLVALHRGDTDRALLGAHAVAEAKTGEDLLESHSILRGSEVDESIPQVVLRCLAFTVEGHVEEVVEVREPVAVDIAQEVLVHAAAGDMPDHQSRHIFRANLVPTKLG